MLIALNYISSEWAAFCACDTPAVPVDYVDRLWQQRGGAKAVWVRSIQRDHPALALLHVSIVQPLSQALNTGERRVLHFLQSCGHAVLFTEDESAFANINTPEELIRQKAKRGKIQCHSGR